MIFKKQFRLITFFTLSIFICFTLTYEYSLAQEEHPLLKAQGLYKQGNFIEAIKVLEAFIEKIKGNPSKNRQLAEAHLMLARIYYETGEDARVAEYMKQAVEAYAEIGKEEGNLDFKTRLEREREKILQNQAGKAETAPVVTKEPGKTESPQPSFQEKEKPAPLLKKKKKSRWLEQILALCIIAGVIYGMAMLLKKKSNPKHIETEATFENGVLTVKGAKEVRYELALIPAGTFQMGSNNGDSDEKPVHTVRISKTFWLGKTEVTQGLWQAVMGYNSSYFKNGDNYPVEQVTWYECQAFITNLNHVLGGNAFRLPTEAEWEYACRAGTTGNRYGNIDAIAWYNSNSGGTTHQVGQKQANAWGLFDTLGNVLEWCQDYYFWYKGGYQIDPTGPDWAPDRVYRGDCWISDAQNVSSAHRGYLKPEYRTVTLGFRLARTNE